MEKEKFNFWKDHSVNYLKMAFQHDKREKPVNADGYGKNTGGCGDTIEMFLFVHRGRIQSVSFDTNGCINTNACCNTVAFLAQDKLVEEAWGITPENVIDYLETLPPQNHHCSELAVGAFYLALSNYLGNQRDPWKKLYQK
ncbi:MAG: iron-sulfur cluster assembly scaffold protein [Desulfobacterales bacterium]